jgi:Xaa-Pro dipeptidase
LFHINRQQAETGPERGFQVSEFEARLARAQSAMADLGVDGLFLTTEPEIRYFTGFLSRFWLSPTRPWFLLVPSTGKPVAIVPSIGRECFDATWLDDVRSWESPQPEDEGVSLLASTIGEVLGQSARIGIPQGPETHLRMPIGDFHRLREMLPGCEFVDATSVISIAADDQVSCGDRERSPMPALDGLGCVRGFSGFSFVWE